MKSTRRSGGLATLVIAAAIALAACSASSTPPAGQGTSSRTAGQGTSSRTVASLPTSTSAGHGPDRGGGSPTTTPPTGNATALVDEWATCMRRHGDPNQTDPVIDSHGGINITIPTGVADQALGEELHNVTGTCSQYLAAAQRVLRADIPYTPFDPDEALNIQYANCMRANGVANYPYPKGDQTVFNGTGINTNSPIFVRANKVCGKLIGAPAWWINGWGPPGDVSSSSGPTHGPPAASPVPGTDDRGSGPNG
jgi:hypothetical protein